MTANDLLSLHQAWIAADQERMKRRPARTPRLDWRRANPIAGVAFPKVRDTRFLSRPTRTLGFVDQSARLFVSSPARFVEVIDLKAPDADARLARYEFVG